MPPTECQVWNCEKTATWTVTFEWMRWQLCTNHVWRWVQKLADRSRVGKPVTVARETAEKSTIR
jgi:hypothetical protein